MKKMTINIPDGFLDEEIRCGHRVTSEMKKVWAVELDLLYVFQQFCSEHNLKWYMAYGSLIGAVRHKGFIPWDNDIDVMMPREDFDKFLEIAPSFFKHPYFLQTPTTENGNYYDRVIKLRNSYTTASSEFEFLQGINGGLFLDIFVLDTVPDNKLILKCGMTHLGFYAHFSRFLSPYKLHYSGLKKVKHFIWNSIRIMMGGVKGDYIFDKSHKCCRKLNNYKGKRCSFLVGGYKPKEIWDKEWWKEIKMMPFEFLSVPIPVDYDKILRRQYGDYLSFPKINERVNHEYLDIAPDIPYNIYFQHKSALQ